MKRISGLLLTMITILGKYFNRCQLSHNLIGHGKVDDGLLLKAKVFQFLELTVPSKNIHMSNDQIKLLLDWTLF